MKTIVTHLSPDLDAIASCWLIKRFLPGWKNAQIKFVPAGKTLDNKNPDENPEIIHVDTGMGRFDHHQTSDNICAATLVFDYFKKNHYLKKNQEEALERIVNQINIFDHFGEINFSSPDADHFDFLISSIIDSGLKSVFKKDIELTEYIFVILDSLLVIFFKKTQAEKEIKKGFIFKSKWGKTLVVSSKNEDVLKLALKKGFKLVARKDPERGNIRIKTPPFKKYHLRSLYQKIVKIDKKANWFLHISGNMLLNGSSKNPNFVPSTLTLKQLIDIIKSV
ncbi:MAG: chromate resistance protein [Patescibacteria group bacterium]|nr:chromate resistance protein [Patescibacteria group bacterium]